MPNFLLVTVFQKESRGIVHSIAIWAFLDPSLNSMPRAKGRLRAY